MTVTRGDPQPSRLLPPGAGALLGYVVLIGNPWLNTDLRISLTGSDSALRLVDVMVFWPAWELDADRFGSFQFWTLNIRTLLFVGLAVAGLARVRRWLRDSTGGMGALATTAGVITLSAVAAGLAAATVVTTFLDTPATFPRAGRETEAYFLGQLNAAASFGVLFGLILGAVVVAQRHGPGATAGRAQRPAKRRVNAPKSFW